MKIEDKSTKQIAQELTQEEVVSLTEKILVGATLISENSELVYKSKFIQSGTKQELIKLHNMSKKLIDSFYLDVNMDDAAQIEFNKKVSLYENSLDE